METQLFSFRRNLLKYATKLCRNADMAEDLVQDTFVKALAAKDRFIPGSNLGAWLSTILHHTYMSQRRNAGKMQMLSENEEGFSLIDYLGGSQPTQEASLMIRDFKVAIAKVSPHRVEFLRLMYVEGMQLTEVSEATGTCVGSVKSGIYRARHQLRELMG